MWRRAAHVAVDVSEIAVLLRHLYALIAWDALEKTKLCGEYGEILEAKVLRSGVIHEYNISVKGKASTWILASKLTSSQPSAKCMHMVPLYQPERAFAFFSRWLEGRPFIDP